MKAKLLDARPLMNVCGRFGFVPDLTHYHVNPRKAPLVVVQLCDDECAEDFIKVERRNLLKRDLIAAYILRATGIVSAYGFPVVVGERAAKEYPQPRALMPALDCLSNLNHMKDRLLPWDIFELQANPRNAPLVVVQLLDDECPEDFGQGLTLSVRSFLPEDPLVEQWLPKSTLSQARADACIRLFEQFKSYEGLYFFLGGYLSSRLDPDIHFKHTEGVAKTGQINYVERRPLINVCGRFGFVPDLTHYHVNPGNGPLVVVQLLDDECPEDFTRSYSICPLFPSRGSSLWSNVRTGALSLSLSLPSLSPSFFVLVERRLKLERPIAALYIAKATHVVSAYGFPVVVGERLDPDIHFKHTEGVAKTGQINYVERSYPLRCMPTTCFDILKDMAKM
ncbi:hypothetical protein H6P81_007134 [Aristolochia fimbriata]|uniref:Uncharacterized protein n=1 Tax=Aristolochia fimbriata TaxID=158543 RepID=A0AAV7EZA4_ARIFI|nr:hypothetical protein H6P81_007134 [Aristolochia fimbriata]